MDSKSGVPFRGGVAIWAAFLGLEIGADGSSGQLIDRGVVISNFVESRSRSELEKPREHVHAARQTEFPLRFGDRFRGEYGEIRFVCFRAADGLFLLGG